MDRDPFDLVGDVLDGQFRVDAFAGEGDLSVVYKGHHLGVDATVAIKCLNLPETLDLALARPLVDGFREASRVHYRLARGNLHIAQTIASGSTLVPRSGVVVPYLVREWYEGESLRSDLARRRDEHKSGRPLEEVLALLETAFDGLAHAHALGEMHLSVNPSNLFLVARAGSSPPALKVLDFGVASTMNAFASGIPSAARPTSGLRLLFPAYAAPEQLDRTVGPLGPATDVYALALVMMEMLSDRIVMGEADSGAIVEHALDDQRRPTPQAHGLKLPSHVDRALARAVARAPERRQKSAAELWKDVRNTVRTLGPRSMMPAPSRSVTPAAPQTSQPPIPLPSRGAPPSPLLPAPHLPTPAPARVRAATLVGLSAPGTDSMEPSPPSNVSSLPGAVGPRSRLPLVPSVTMRPKAFEPISGSPPAPPPPSLSPPAALAPPASPPPSGDPPPATPSASGPIEPWPLPLRRRQGLFDLARSPRAIALALPVAGALFWCAVAAAFLLVLAAPLRRPDGRGDAVPATAALSAPVAAPPAPSPPPPPAPSPPPDTPPAAAAAPSTSGAPFPSALAVRALDGKWRDVAKCRRGKAFGKASTTITFAGSGAVTHVDVGWPFAGTPTADCIADKLGSARVAAFGDADATLVYRVYVAPR
jgi:serine/threonine protein kinase